MGVPPGFIGIQIHNNTQCLLYDKLFTTILVVILKWYQHVLDKKITMTHNIILTSIIQYFKIKLLVYLKQISYVRGANNTFFSNSRGCI